MTFQVHQPPSHKYDLTNKEFEFWEKKNHLVEIWDEGKEVKASYKNSEEGKKTKKGWRNTTTALSFHDSRRKLWHVTKKIDLDRYKRHKVYLKCGHDSIFYKQGDTSKIGSKTRFTVNYNLLML